MRVLDERIAIVKGRDELATAKQGGFAPLFQAPFDEAVAEPIKKRLSPEALTLETLDAIKSGKLVSKKRIFAAYGYLRSLEIDKPDAYADLKPIVDAQIEVSKRCAMNFIDAPLASSERQADFQMHVRVLKYFSKKDAWPEVQALSDRLGYRAYKTLSERGYADAEGGVKAYLAIAHKKERTAMSAWQRSYDKIPATKQSDLTLKPFQLAGKRAEHLKRKLFRNEIKNDSTISVQARKIELCFDDVFNSLPIHQKQTLKVLRTKAVAGKDFENINWSPSERQFLGLKPRKLSFKKSPKESRSDRDAALRYKYLKFCNQMALFNSKFAKTKTAADANHVLKDTQAWLASWNRGARLPQNLFESVSCVVDSFPQDVKWDEPSSFEKPKVLSAMTMPSI